MLLESAPMDWQESKASLHFHTLPKKRPFLAIPALRLLLHLVLNGLHLGVTVSCSQSFGSRRRRYVEV